MAALAFYFHGDFASPAYFIDVHHREFSLVDGAENTNRIVVVVHHYAVVVHFRCHFVLLRSFRASR